MQTIDLTHLMHGEMPVYPGTPKPVFSPVASLDNEGYREMFLEMTGHTGTHMDAPAHMLRDGKSIDQFPVDHFSGKAVVIGIQEGTRLIGITLLKEYENAIARAEYVLLRTGWSRYWEEERYVEGFPVLSEEAARWLVSFPLKGIGVDVISVDAASAETFPVHLIFFNAGMVIVENLCFPPDFNPGMVHFTALPLHYLNADGAPVRAIAVPISNPGHLQTPASRG